jgi:RNA polymerase sigma-70 factor (ECF subfamily)
MGVSVQTESRVDAEPATMDVVFDQHVQRVFQFLYTRVGNREDAEDLTSEVFLKASHQLDLQRTNASISTWLFTVARTVLADHWRRYYRFGAIMPINDHNVMAAPPGAEAENSGDEAEKNVERILAALPERYRRVLELRFLRGLSIRETAEEMGVTPQNAKVIQHRALAHAVARFDAPGAGDDATVRALASMSVQP